MTTLLQQLKKLNPFRASRANTLALLEEQPKPALIALVEPEPVETVDARYLSFSIDISVLAGGFWWEGSNGVRRGLGTLRVPPLDLNSKKLDRLVRALGPSYLRVGGSEADKIHYFESDERGLEVLVLSKKMWDSLHQFIQRNNLKFTFTFKYGLFKRKQQGEWTGTEIQKLLQYSKEQNYTIDVCELGNELNAYWAFHGLRSQPGAKDLAHDYATFTQLVRRYYPNIRICGPGSAFWPILGETIKPFSNITKKFLESLRTELDIVDWHYYPFQSERSPVRTRTATINRALSSKSFETFGHYSKQLRHMRDIHQPEAELWTGETGSAQCGGQPKISDRYTSCFWWADQLGQGARLGQKVMIRQSLIGGDYGMIDRLTLKPRPDYWVSWLWGQLMGEDVYEVASQTPDLRTYCHKHKTSEDLCLLAINISEQNITLNAHGFGPVVATYALTAKKLTAKKLFINGMRPEFKKGEVSLDDFPQAEFSNVLQPCSINFWRINKPKKRNEGI
ncbi:glycoside hydrolase [Teredinibacter haidensis]|uniref:glycoside hydrolase n=1 Tax=Teredinibacter haidensis TaxID=2731755 RepID=UPI0009FA2980|nr:glycoside hydrolase [Teredinibacter haidensis]